MSLIRKLITKKNNFLRKLFKDKKIKKYLDHNYTVYYSKEKIQNYAQFLKTLPLIKVTQKTKLIS